MTRRTALTAAALWLCSSAAVYADHVFPLREIRFGVKILYFVPELLLLLAVSGLLLSYKRRRDVLIGFAAFLAGLVLGLPFDYFWPTDLVWLCLILIVLFGGMIALQVFAPVRMLQAYLFLAGGCFAPMTRMGRNFEGVSWVVVAAFLSNVLVILTLSYLVSAALRYNLDRHSWLAILLRVFGSWAAAAAIIISAFYLSAPA